MTRRANQRTEHAARIAHPGEFRAGSYRRKHLGRGVSLVVAKRPGARKTEVQSIRFDASEFTPSQARQWLMRYGYTPQEFASANPNPCSSTSNASPANPRTVETELVRSHLGTAAVELAHAWTHADRVAAYKPTVVDAIREATSATSSAISEASRIAQLPSNPDAGADAPPAVGDNAHAAVAVAVASAPDVPPESNPSADDVRRSWEDCVGVCYGIVPPPAENPRTLVQIGQARRLDLDTGIRYRWTIGDDWRVLVPSGAEQLAAGAGRLFLVPSTTESSATPPPPAGAGPRTFEEWHKFDARKQFTIDVPAVEEFRHKVGTGTTIVYRSDKWDKDRVDYEHAFSKRSPPEVFVIGSPESPRAVLVRGGEFRTTARGLVD